MKESESHAGNRVTLKGIARIAGVSVSTTSAVLSGRGVEARISLEVQRRVREVARQHDYSPNLLVRSLKRGRTDVLSFYSAHAHRGRNDLYMDRLTTAIERASGQRKYDVLIHCDFTRSADEDYRRLCGGRADGLIFIGPNEDSPLLDLLRTSRLPTVILCHVDPQDILSSVCEDRSIGMQMVVDELVRLGHRRIAAISGRPNTDAEIRITELRTRLAAYDIALPERWVIPSYEDGPHKKEDILRFLLNEPEPPTALFCWHDRAGYDMLEACEEMGISVPGQLSFIGYDGLQWPSKSSHVLATIDVQLDRLAETAVSFLDELIQGKSVAPLRKMIPPSLMRGTTLAAFPTVE